MKSSNSAFKKSNLKLTSKKQPDKNSSNSAKCDYINYVGFEFKEH